MTQESYPKRPVETFGDRVAELRNTFFPEKSASQPTPVLPSKGQLCKIYNDVAQQAIKDFPNLHQFTIYSHITGTFHGTTPDDARRECLIKEAIAAKNANSMARGGRDKRDHRKSHFIIHVDSVTARALSSTIDTPETEIRGILGHELGHIVAPGGLINNDPNQAECIADTFGFARSIQEGRSAADKILEAQIWQDSFSLVICKDTTYFSAPALEALHALHLRQDITHLKPVETANLAYRISREYGLPEEKLTALAEIFAPLAEHWKTKCQVPVDGLMEIAMQDHGALTDDVFKISKTLLTAFLDQKVDILGMMLDSSRTQVNLEGPYWQNARHIFAKDSPEPQDFIETQAIDMKMLGYFERTADQMITPETYESADNQRHLLRSAEIYKDILRSQTAGEALSPAIQAALPQHVANMGARDLARLSGWLAAQEAALQYTAKTPVRNVPASLNL
jgi:hypothetical protein